MSEATRDSPTDRESPTLGRVLEILESALNYRDWIFSLADPHLGKRVLEVGAGSGTMLDCVVDREHAIGLEIDPGFACAMEERFQAHPNVSVVCGSVTQSATMQAVSALQPDSAMTFNVLEHIDDDEEALRSIASVLRPGDALAVLVPAFPAIFGAMDRGVGHVRRYRRSDLVAKMERAGFDVPVAHYVNAVGYFAWFVNGRVLRSTAPVGGARAIDRYDRHVIPVLRRIERSWRPPFGQSLFAVGTRR